MQKEQVHIWMDRQNRHARLVHYFNKLSKVQAFATPSLFVNEVGAL